MTNERYVDELTANAGITLLPSERGAMIDKLNSGAMKRAQVLLDIVNTKSFAEKEATRSLVLLHYFGYLHRNPDDPPDNNLSGFNFWVAEVEKAGQIGRLANAFMASDEYEQSGRKR
jgi:hypothetical protein